MTECLELQLKINGVIKWEGKWQMDFNPEKCYVIRLEGVI